jgi:L-erythro-3,5-diaminohexanoate dehydrogenase
VIRSLPLVSLSLTPLKLEEIIKLEANNDQVDVKAQAILFESGIFAVLPDDIPEKLALAALDVAGAPAQVDRLVKEGDTVCIIGGGGKIRYSLLLPGNGKMWVPSEKLL